MRALAAPLRRSFATTVLASAVLATVGFATAAPKKKKADADASASATTAAVSSAPSASKGITPYDQQMIDANKAMAAGLAGGALDDALNGYRKAITIDPTRPEGYVYLAGALFQKADYPAAEEALAAAQARAKDDVASLPSLGRALFLRAMVLEAEGKPDDAKTAWQAYGAFAKDHPDQDAPRGAGDAPPMTLKVYPGSALEREAKIELNAKMREDYAKVKVLIEKRQRELGDEPKK